MESKEEIVRLARSEMAREAVEKRWAKLDGPARKEAVKAANEGRRKQAARRRQWLEGHARRMGTVAQLGMAMGQEAR